MCLITALQSTNHLFKHGGKEVDYDMLRNAWYFNEDGAGFTFVDFNHLNETKVPIVRIYKNYMSFDKFLKSFKKTREMNPRSMFLIHFRNASMGSSSKKENCHPFWIHEKEMSMVHNGTIYKIGAKKDEGPSDSSLLADFLSKLPKNWIKNEVYKHLVHEYIGKINKVAILTNENIIYRFNSKEWIKEGDTFFSNDYYKKEKPKLITYNTNTIKLPDTCEQCGALWGGYVMPILINGKYLCGKCVDEAKKEISNQLFNNRPIQHCKICDIELIYPNEFDSGRCIGCEEMMLRNASYNVYDDNVYEGV